MLAPPLRACLDAEHRQRGERTDRAQLEQGVETAELGSGRWTALTIT